MTATNRKDDSSNYEDQYCDMLDELGPVKIGSLEYQASMVLKLVDETAYRCGLNDYADSCEDERECSECGEVYDDEEEAEKCCTKHTDEEDRFCTNCLGRVDKIGEDEYICKNCSIALPKDYTVGPIILPN